MAHAKEPPAFLFASPPTQILAMRNRVRDQTQASFRGLTAKAAFFFAASLGVHGGSSFRRLPDPAACYRESGAGIKNTAIPRGAAHAINAYYLPPINSVPMPGVPCQPLLLPNCQAAEDPTSCAVLLYRKLIPGVFSYCTSTDVHEGQLYKSTQRAFKGNAHIFTVETALTFMEASQSTEIKLLNRCTRQK